MTRSQSKYNKNTLKLKIGLTDVIDLKADLLELGVVEDVTSIEDEGGLHHALVDGLVVVVLELVPLGHDDDGMSIATGFDGVLDDGDHIVESGVGLGVDMAGVVELHEHGGLRDLGIVHDDSGLLVEEVLGDVGGSGLTGVTSVLLEGEAEHADLLAVDGIEHGVDDVLSEAALLVVVDLDDVEPVLGDLVEAVVLAEVDEVEHILLEAGATEADGGGEELAAETRVRTDSAGDLSDIGADLLADGGDGVDGGDSLGEEAVGGQLGELGGPDVGGDDALARHPAVVEVNHDLEGGETVGGLLGAEEDTRGLEKIVDGGTLSEELGVVDDAELDAGIGLLEDSLEGGGGTDGDGGLLNDNLVVLGATSDGTGGELEVLQVGGRAGADTKGLGGSLGMEGGGEAIR